MLTVRIYNASNTRDAKRTMCAASTAGAGAAAELTVRLHSLPALPPFSYLKEFTGNTLYFHRQFINRNSTNVINSICLWQGPCHHFTMHFGLKDFKLPR